MKTAKTVHLSFKSATLLFRLADYFKPSKFYVMRKEENVAMALVIQKQLN
jgi:hypothetical protein